MGQEPRRVAIQELRRRRMLGALAAAVPGAAALAACGTSSSGTAAPTAAAQTGRPQALPPATIGWDTFRGFTPVTEWPKTMVESFQAKYPQIKVEARAIALEGGQQSAYPKMLAMAAAGTLGEVHAWDPSHWQLYQAIKRNLIRPIDTYVARDKYDLNQFYKPFIEYQKWEGKIWGLPSWGWTGQDGLLYNTEMFQAAGATMPAPNSPDWTMHKLYEIAVKVGKYAERAGGFGLRLALPGAAGVTILTRAFNADNLSADGKKSTLLDPAPKEAMRWAHDLANREKVVALPGTYQGNIFVSGALGIDQQGSLGVFNTNRDNKDGILKFKAQLFPKRKDGKRPSQLRGGTWNLAQQAKFPDHGWEFIKHITNREGALLFNTIGGNGALVRPDIMTDTYFQDANFKVFLENFENSMSHVVPANFRGTEFEAAFVEKGGPFYKGEVGFEDGLRTLNEEVQRVLDQPPV
ncbi:MAG: extracellular solute-binding protein [Chloroflexi bacterium]|nr:extracellular solute-binding protein [Chloroflexota bacterium]